MTDYVLDDVLGDDVANTGLSGSPFQSIPRINHLDLSSGDTIEFVNNGNIYQGELRPSVNGISINGNDNIVTGSVDVSDGEIYTFMDENYSTRTNVDRNLFFNKFTGGVIDTWSRLGASAYITEETSVVMSGLGSSLKMDGISAGTTAYIRQNFPPCKAPMRMTFAYNSAQGLKMDLQATGDSYYAQIDNDGVFSGYAATLSRPTMPATSGFDTWQTDWITRDYAEAAPARVQILVSSTVLAYVQMLKIEYRADWQVHDAVNGVYKLSIPSYDSANHALMKCSHAEWAADNFSALEYIPMASSLADIQAGNEPGTQWQDGDGNMLYYQLAEGEVIADLHLQWIYATFSSCYMSDGCTLDDIKLRGGANAGYINESSNPVITRNLDSQYNRGYGGYDKGPATHHMVKLNNNGDYWLGDSYPGPLNSNGHLADGAAAIVHFDGGEIAYNGDDGFQPINGATVTSDGLLVHSNRSEQVSITSGNIYPKRCTFAHGTRDKFSGQPVINDRLDAAGDALYTRNYKDNYIVVTPGAGVAIDIDYDANGNVSADGNIVIGSINDAGAETFSNQAGLVTSDDGFTVYPSLVTDDYVASDFTPANTSNAVGGSTKDWGNKPRPSSATGEPRPDEGVDKSAVQTTLNSGHPRNLP